MLTLSIKYIAKKVQMDHIDVLRIARDGGLQIDYVRDIGWSVSNYAARGLLMDHLTHHTA